MSVNKLRRLPLAAAALIACVSAQAEYQSPDGKFRLSGFGTLGLARTTTNDAGFNYRGQGGGAGTTPSFDPDSKIAVQGTYKATQEVSFTSQVMMKYDAEAQYIPKVDWLFAKWQATPNFNMRVGRLGAPYFMISDFRDVGFANVFVRPPLDVYSQVPISQFDGADFSYQLSIGSSTLTTSFWAGDSDTNYALKKYNGAATPNAITHKNTTEVLGLKVNRTRGINFLWELDNGLAFRLGHAQGKLSVNSNASKALVATTRALAPSFYNNTYDTFTADSAFASFSGVGFSYDSGNILLNGEYTKRKTESYVSDTTGYYLFGGYRFGKWIPFAGVSKLKTDRRAVNPFKVLGSSNALYQSAEALLGTQKVDDRTTSLGVRWDATSSLAVKAQWDHINKPADATGVFFDPTTAFVNEKRTVNALTLSVDFVF